MAKSVVPVVWLVVGILLTLMATGTSALEPEHGRPTVEVLRHAGAELEIRLAGEVVWEDGAPATGVKVSCGLTRQGRALSLQPTINGNRFELWVPVNRSGIWSGWIKAESTDGAGIAYERLASYELRQASLDGIRLTLRKPTREVRVKVLHRGQPVAGAQVAADVGYGIKLPAKTDVDGVARFALLPEQEVSRLAAWTDDYRVGGFSFSRNPPRDPSLNDHELELHDCRDQIVKFVDQQGDGVEGVDFTMQVATPQPDYNYLGHSDLSWMTTDEAGKAVYRWLPDWDAHHLYAELDSSEWVLDGKHETIGDTLVFRVKPATQRQRVTGNVTSPSGDAAGFWVRLRSFQGERKNYSDVVDAYTDPDGTFAVEVLPDATYCAWVLDAKWVGETIHLVPYWSESGKTTPIELTVCEGQEVEVFATSGAEKRPLANLSIRFRRNYEYTWLEDGKSRSGSSGPQWWARTDQSGRAVTRTLPGELKTYVYTPLWRQEQRVRVINGEPITIRYHREIDEPRTVVGELKLAEGVMADLAGAEVVIGAMDGETNEQHKITIAGSPLLSPGVFSFDTRASRLGVFARTRDGAAAGLLDLTDTTQPFQVTLRPTGGLSGRLINDQDEPIAGHRVQALVRMSGPTDFEKIFSNLFEPMRVATHTDHRGEFSFSGLPIGMEIYVFADGVEDPDDYTHLKEVRLKEGQGAPRLVKRLSRGGRRPKSVDGRSLAERLAQQLRDSSLLDLRVLLIASDNHDEALSFVHKHFRDYDANRDVSSFLSLSVAGGDAKLSAADKQLLKSRDWPQADGRTVFACAIDADGQELGRLTLSIDDEQAPAKAAAFVRDHKPPQADAAKKWREAFAEAERSNRRVWARVSQRYCGPCFLMARWLDDQRELIEKEFVLLKVDNVRDENGGQIAERITGGGRFGVPFHAMFAADGRRLIDSQGPAGNIGHPASAEGKEHLREMLLTGPLHLTGDEVERLIRSLDD